MTMADVLEAMQGIGQRFDRQDLRLNWDNGFGTGKPARNREHPIDAAT